MIGAREIFRILNEHDVDYVTVGGLAQTLQGVVIKTDDVDICPSTAPDNLVRVAEALAAINAKEWLPDKGEAVEREWSGELLQQDSLWILHTDFGPLDLLFTPEGTHGFEGLVDDAEVKDVGGLEVPVASLDALIEMKEAIDRPKDREHLSYLRRLRRLRKQPMGRVIEEELLEDRRRDRER